MHRSKYRYWKEADCGRELIKAKVILKYHQRKISRTSEVDLPLITSLKDRKHLW